LFVIIIIFFGGGVGLLPLEFAILGGTCLPTEGASDHPDYQQSVVLQLVDVM
jgi:hypothetical protein